MTGSARAVPEDEILGCVVSFEPDEDSIRNIRAMRAQFARMLVVDNSSTVEARNLISARCLEAGIDLVQNGKNLGQAEALNQACRFAQANGYSWVMFLDQDTKVLPSFLGTFVEFLERIPAKLDETVVGCEYTNARRRARRARASAAVSSQRVVITTGSLVSTRLWERVGGFRSDYFIDLVDDEFCLRVRREGGSVWRMNVPLVEHRIGNSTGRRWALNYSPERWYYLVRNHLWTLREYAWFDPWWAAYTIALKMRMIAGLLHETERLPKLRGIVRGLRDGVARARP